MLGSAPLLLSAAVVGVQAGNTTCKTTSLDWYTKSVGETPCRTYERLRQNCDDRYQVGNFNFAVPGDVCNSQVSACCCNSVAFALSMLCLNCQWGYGSGIGDDTGIDALQAGTYQFYLNHCGPITNQSLSKDTQAAVCNQNINIPNYVYTLFWNTGNWYYEFTRQTAQLQIQSGQNASHCAAPPTSSMISATGNPTPTSSSPIPSPSSDDSSSANIGAIIGGVIGGVGLLLIATLVFWFSRRRRSNQVVDLTEEEREQSQDMAFEPYIDRPSTVAPSEQPLSSIPGSSAGYAQTHISSDAASTAYVPLPRPAKVGLVESSAPNRDESRPLMLAPDMNDRHEDSAELTEALGLGRSASGRLPPGYRER